MKLIHCIHLQQLELTQRAVASHERATDIAKEFARVIEGFEERLVSVENNVHKETMAIKSIAESLTLAKENISSRNEESERDGKGGVEGRISHAQIVEERLALMENVMDTVVQKLDNIALAVSRK